MSQSVQQAVVDTILQRCELCHQPSAHELHGVDDKTGAVYSLRLCEGCKLASETVDEEATTRFRDELAKWKSYDAG